MSPEDRDLGYVWDIYEACGEIVEFLGSLTVLSEHWNSRNRFLKNVMNYTEDDLLPLSALQHLVFCGRRGFDYVCHRCRINRQGIPGGSNITNSKESP